MVTKEQEEENRSQEQEEQSSNFNDLFEFDDNQEEDEDNSSLINDFKGWGDDNQEDESNENDEENQEEDDGKEDENFLNNEKEEDEENQEDNEIDLEKFNKKLETDFKTIEELKSFLKKENSSENKEEKELEEINKQLEIYEPLIKLDDETLMRRQFESVALQEGKDLNDEDVNFEIEEQIQELKETKTLNLYAKNLREELKNKVINPSIEKKNKIEEAKERRIQEEKKKEEEEIQNNLIDIYKSKQFFGIDIDKEKVKEVYKNVSSGKFLDLISNDKKALSELAMMWFNRDQISKKASGKSYSDGIKSVLDEFSSKKEKDTIARAQQKGSSGGSSKSKGLINDLLFSKKEKE